MNGFPRFFFPKTPQHSQVFWGDIFYKRLNLQAQIFKHFHARRISNMYPDLENPNIIMITNPTHSQISSIASSYAIPFFLKKKFWRAHV